MSLYIHQENQKLIWESIHKLPMFQEFGKHEEGKRETWFRSIIQQFYESNKFKLLSVEELQQLNRETVSYMLTELKASNKKEEPIYYDGFSSSFGDMSPINTERPTITSFSTMPPENKHVTRDAILEKKQEQLNQQFSARQQEYGSMLQSGPANEIDFRLDAQSDSPIENIDALMEEKMKQRKYDLENMGFKPPDAPDQTQPAAWNGGPNNPLSPTDSFSSPRSPIQLDVIDLAKTESMQNNTSQIVRSNRFPYKDITDTPQKSVRWNESSPIEPVKHRPPQYSRSVDNTSIFKDFMEDIRDTMNDMKREIFSLKQTASTSSTQLPKQNPLVNNIVSRMKRKTVPANQLQDVTNEFV